MLTHTNACLKRCTRPYECKFMYVNVYPNTVWYFIILVAHDRFRKLFSSVLDRVCRAVSYPCLWKIKCNEYVNGNKKKITGFLTFILQIARHC